MRRWSGDERARGPDSDLCPVLFHFFERHEGHVVTEALSDKLGIKVGETDASGLFTLMEFECLGACDRAPIVMVNNEHWHEKVRPEDAGKLVDEIRAKGDKVFTGCHLDVER
jgi:NADH-quinone oxidoreductase subunit E